MQVSGFGVRLLLQLIRERQTQHRPRIVERVRKEPVVWVRHPESATDPEVVEVCRSATRDDIDCEPNPHDVFNSCRTRRANPFYQGPPTA